MDKPIDYRALCAELLDEWDAASGDPDLISFAIAIARVRAALAQSEPEGLTDEDLIELFNENDWNYISPETFIDIARTVLEHSND